ncbi:MAG: hypothetical protein J5850_01185 [Clostridia bacterium]|nr:hypothetical protein [Clostridia bacterium]
MKKIYLLITFFLLLSFALSGCADIGKTGSEVDNNDGVDIKHKVLIVFLEPENYIAQFSTWAEDYCIINNIDFENISLEQREKMIELYEYEQNEIIFNSNKYNADNYLDKEDIIEISNNNPSAVAYLTSLQIKELESKEGIVRVSIIDDYSVSDDYKYPDKTADFYKRNKISISNNYYRPDVVFVSRENYRGITADIFYENNKMRFDSALVTNDDLKAVDYSVALSDDDLVAVIITNLTGKNAGPLYNIDPENPRVYFKENVFNYLTGSLGFEVVGPEIYLESGQFQEEGVRYYYPLVIGRWKEIENMINNQNAFLEGCGYTEEELNLNGNGEEPLYASLVVSFAVQYKES